MTESERAQWIIRTCVTVTEGDRDDRESVAAVEEEMAEDEASRSSSSNLSLFLRASNDRRINMSEL